MDCCHGVRRRIHPNDRVSTAVEQSFECREKDASDIVGRVIGLDADTQHSTLAHGVAAACDVANPGAREHQILVAHQLGHCGDDFRDDGALNPLYLKVCGSVIEKELAKLSDGHTSEGAESFLVVGFKNQARDLVAGGSDRRTIDQRAPDNILERQVGKFSFRRDSLSFRSCGNPSQLVARLFLVGFGKQFAKVGEIESLNHGIISARYTMLSK